MGKGGISRLYMLRVLMRLMHNFPCTNYHNETIKYDLICLYHLSIFYFTWYLYCNEIAGYTAHMYQQFILIALKDKTKYV